MNVPASPLAAPRERRRRGGAALAAMALWLMSGMAMTRALAQDANPTGVAVFEFQKRLETYVKLRERAVADVPKLKETPSPAEIDAREKAMAAALRAARGNAQMGDLVSPVETLIRRIVRADWAARPAVDRQALATEIPRVGRLTVNTPYPASLPLATVPPVLLQKLPRLPEVLEYRLMGRYLVLRDVSANLIVDAVERALPSR
jgi:hypothetical protein